MSKYGNKKIEVDGIVFDSRKEANRYKDLKMLQDVGIIRNLHMQVKFILIPAQYSSEVKTKNGKSKCIERECTYVADFAYYDEFGQYHVEDTKGFRTKDYIIKRKLMLHVHGIRIEEK